jgi:hypothetical protein
MIKVVGLFIISLQNFTCLTPVVKMKVKLFLQQALEAHRIVKRQGSHIFFTVGSQMAVRLSALHASRPLFPGLFLVLISVRG